MDGRAVSDIDKATVLETCESIEEAKKNIRDFGADSCIVDMETYKVIFSLQTVSR